MASWSWIACACSAALILTACRSNPLPDYGSVPSFTLTAQDNSQFNSASLQGSVWVADFIFTNCDGPCPRMTSQMRKIEQAYPASTGLKLVSFTVDPSRDTPAALAQYAAKFHADHNQWVFLTGPVPELHNLSRKVFMLGDVDGKTFDHSTRFVLVDRKGRYRGSYLTSEPETMPKLMADIKVLLREKN